MTQVKLQKPAGPALTGGGVKLQTGGVKLASSKPSFAGMFDATTDANPLAELPAEQDVEAAILAETQAIRAQFQTKYRGELQRFRALDDPEYWVMLVFQTHDQKLEFLTQAGWLDAGDKYLDGLLIARRLGVNIAAIPLGRSAPTAMPQK